MPVYPDSEDGYKWELEDASASDAGRTEDVVMHKKRIGQTDAVTLKFSGLSIANASKILKMFNPEYITVKYLNMLEGGYVTKEFYVGNRSAPLYNSSLNVVDNVTFKIVARKG
nr:MAG TPA: hypothetical protein [Caudoviricetes sp.]DAP02356.1 MAG TPA: hypothetical protein [Caudoviricetes sp.]DAV86289.1 MAG TPA: hypothetical protein [Caudoviricetes sp.]DAZ54268.1 MAG TPA: hypothetical protein [Caudoviricetes sp.]